MSKRNKYYGTRLKLIHYDWDGIDKYREWVVLPSDEVMAKELEMDLADFQKLKDTLPSNVLEYLGVGVLVCNKPKKEVWRDFCKKNFKIVSELW